MFGSNTVVTALKDAPSETESDFAKPNIDPGDVRPYGIIPDSRGRIRNLHAVRNMGYLKDVIILVSESTPKDYLEYLEKRNYEYIVAGKDHVDFEKAFGILYDKYHCRMIRTDSGGELTSVLLEQGLVDEISLVVSPCLIGSGESTAFRTLSPKARIGLKLVNTETVNDDYLSLTYRVLR
jgi:2,5-diamino-6-(ribosylamino)-4(3H)-pyrimidinone 5'-phosphate reductase